MLTGYTQLQARIHAISSPETQAVFMKMLGTAAISEQRLLFRRHRKTGITGATIRLVEVTSTTALTTVGGAGIYVELGTRPHLITPNAAKALAWANGPAGGAFRRLSGATRKGVSAANMTFAKSVHHPGTKPSPFMLPGAELAVQKAGLEPLVGAWNSAA